MAILELKNIVSGYGDNMILEDFDISISEGKFVSLLGPSGCGKTTTLRLIAGFSEAKQGEVLFQGEDYTAVPTHKRNFGFVFQSYALFPHMTIYDNVAFGLKMRKTPKDEIHTAVMEMLEVVDLTGYEKRLPKELSGGQRQRVALARALVIKPDLLLMDEPLSNLDAKLRVKMRVEIRKIQQKLGITTIYVTHDQEECFAISDEVAIMNHGKIEQMDSPINIYSKPKTKFIANFVGFENFIPVKYDSALNSYIANDGAKFEAIGETEGDLVVAIRPEDIEFAAEGQTDNVISGTVQVATYLGKQFQYNIDTVYGSIVFKSPILEQIPLGETVHIQLPASKLIAMLDGEVE